MPRERGARRARRSVDLPVLHGDESPWRNGDSLARGSGGVLYGVPEVVSADGMSDVNSLAELDTGYADFILWRR